MAWDITQNKSYHFVSQLHFLLSLQFPSVLRSLLRELLIPVLDLKYKHFEVRASYKLVFSTNKHKENQVLAYGNSHQKWGQNYKIKTANNESLKVWHNQNLWDDRNKQKIYSWIKSRLNRGLFAPIQFRIFVIPSPI